MTALDRQPPRARPAAAALGVLAALLLVALGVVGVHDLAVDRGRATGSAWVTAVLDAVDGLRAGTATTAVGVALAVLGLLLVVAALKPGRRTHVATTVDPDLWVSPAALATMATAVADRQPGVVTVGSEPRHRTVAVRVVAREDRAAVEQRVRAALDERLAPLTARRLDVGVEEVAR